MDHRFAMPGSFGGGTVGGQIPMMPGRPGEQSQSQSQQNALPFTQENPRGGPDLRDYHPNMMGAYGSGSFGGIPQPDSGAVADQQQRERAAEMAKSLQARFRMEVEKVEKKLRREYLGIGIALALILIIVLWRSSLGTGGAKVEVAPPSL